MTMSETTKSTQPLALVVDDEPMLCKLMQITLTQMGINSHTAYNLEQAYQLFEQNDYAFCFTDLGLPDGSGLELVQKVVKSGKNTPIAVITAHGDLQTGVEAMKLGAFDYVNKPVELPKIRSMIENALKASQLHKLDMEQITITETGDALSPQDILLRERLIGVSKPMDELRATIKKVARSQAPVFLWGASGTGKEVVARLIHDLSSRGQGSFVPVNCGAIPSELMESEFFGHKKGSFTGATTDKIGLFQQANGGTLFLDEVADLPLAMQVKLLRAIQEKTVRAIGDTKEVSVDVRILSATHKDLNKLVQAGTFRQDLFYRINVIMVKLPTLNERKEDIGRLANHFLQLIANDWQIDIPTLSQTALDALQKHDFEGNVRELRNLLERAVTMSEDNEIQSKHLFVSNEFVKPIPQTPSPKPTNSYQAGVAVNRIQINYGYAPKPVPLLPPKPEEELLIDDDYDDEPIDLITDNPAETIALRNTSIHNINKQELPTPHYHSIPLPKEGLEQYLLNQEKMLIIAALVQSGNNKTNAAKLLGMSFRSLRYRMKKLEISEYE